MVIYINNFHPGRVLLFIHIFLLLIAILNNKVATLTKNLLYIYSVENNKIPFVRGICIKGTRELKTGDWTLCRYAQGESNGLP